VLSLDRPAVPAVVRSWDDQEGCGVVDAPQVPGGCWVLWSVVEMSGYRALVPGEGVSLAYEPAEQDGYLYRAIAVRPDHVDPAWHPEPATSDAASIGLGGAHTSTLTLAFDDGSPTLTGDEATAFVTEELDRHMRDRPDQR
jgi:CspA family cold shock protein